MKTKKQGRTSRATACLATAGLLFTLSSSCSVYKAASQPERKNMSVLSEGTPRGLVIAELGGPSWSGEREGKKVDLFAFKQGYSKGAKVGRAFFHGAADVVTAGLWEVVATPIETIADGSDVKVEVTYDDRESVALVNFLQGSRN